MEKTFTVNRDGLDISCLLAAPEGEARGLVYISHGMIEIKERYLPLMRHLAGRGYACQIHDQRGHGQSVKSPSDLGYLYRDGARALPRDVADMCAMLKTQYPGKKLCLIGHSMGSLVSLSCLKQYSGSFDALLLSGCPAPNPAAGPGMAMVKAMKLIKGERYRSRMLENIMFGPYQKRFTPRSTYNWINTDPAEVRLHETDPAMNYSFTLNGCEALLGLMRFDYDKTPFRPRDPRLPILFLAGEDDPCIGSPAQLRAVADRLQKDGYQDVSVKVYPGVRHEIFRAPEKEVVFSDVDAFLGRALGV